MFNGGGPALGGRPQGQSRRNRDANRARPERTGTRVPYRPVSSDSDCPAP